MNSIGSIYSFCSINSMRTSSTERFIYLKVYLIGYMRTSAKQKGKILISLNREMISNLDSFVSECDNPQLNRSAIIDEILYEIFTNQKVTLDKLFPLDKRFKNSKK